MTEVVKRNIMDFFPLDVARRTQEIVLKEIQNAFESGKKVIVLEAPVGSGKSAMALTVAGFYGTSHIITPKKSLQDQYFDDFEDDIVLMKGRNAYPCTVDANNKEYKRVIKLIKTGSIEQPKFNEPNCANAPCRDSRAVYNACKSMVGECPYVEAMNVAQDHHTVVHNIHSFIFQGSFGGKFEKREVLMVDEAHEIEGVIRGFITKKMVMPGQVESPPNTLTASVEEWCDFFMDDKFLPKISAREQREKDKDPEFMTDRDKYMEEILIFKEKADLFGNGFTVKRHFVQPPSGVISNTIFEFIPHSIGKAASNLLFEYGEKILLMSGTIYDKNFYCRSIGLDPNDVYFIRVPSSFPVKNRPIYLKKEFQTDTSYANWEANFPSMIANIKTIMNKFNDVKGLIHAPSYDSMYEIASALGSRRVVTHDKGNFQEVLTDFYENPHPQVLISPICQQGVDFKYDRARFQIVLRIPYLNTSDEFVNFKVKNDFPWYNFQALIIFGQQIGRVNRADDDFGATFLLDSRFDKFLASNSSRLPTWLKNGIVR